MNYLLNEPKPNIEAEQAVMGSILLSPDTVMPETFEILKADDFLVSEYRTLFQACADLFISGRPIEAITLAAKLGNEYKTIIIRCAEMVVSVANWKVYAKLVSDTAKRHRAFSAVSELKDALSENRDIEDCQSLAVEACKQLTTASTGETVSAAEGFSKFYMSLEKPIEYIQTGFSKIDNYAFISRGDFIVIGARPSAGKTALTLQMMLNISRKHTAVYFSLETRNNNLFGRMAANMSLQSLSDIKRHSGFDYCKLAELDEAFRDLNFYTVEAAGWTAAQIKAKAIQLGAEIIFIDYMGLISAEGSGRYEKMTNISIDLHTMAQQSNITVVALSQLNREGKGEPGMEALRESGQIEQDADIIMLLHVPDDDYPDERELIIAKNKEGKTGMIKLIFNGEIQKFAELETRYE